MGIALSDPKIDQLIDELTALKGQDAVRLAIIASLESELAEARARRPLANLTPEQQAKYDRIKPILERIDSWPRTGLVADKAFYDSLNDE
ncbi:transcription factor [Oryzibacter oryziterrae]|uniref:transcription factor n=1 Tax=Oryzibacter oryziterrae TaxID=2766474 RepID=UPI001F40C761|nr:transcription factor [Oryzibacter oryziterrae]